MNIIDLSIKRTVFAWILMAAFIVFGAISLSRMGISQMPDVDFPVLTLSINYDGASPEVVESDLLDPIEQRLLSIEGIKEMRSSAKQGSGSVTLEFDINRNVDVALQEVQAALSQMRYPSEVDPPVIKKQNPEEDPILIVSIYGDKNLKDILNWCENYLLDQLRFIPGVGEVSSGGFSSRNLRVWLDAKKLETYYLTIDDVVNALSSQHLESAAGQFTEGKRELRVRWRGEASDVEDISNIQILRRGGQRIYDKEIYIKDLAVVEDGLSDQRRRARVGGKQAVAIQIRKQRGTNEVDVSQAVLKKLEEIKPQFPPELDYRVNVDFTRSTKSTVDLTKEKLLVAGLITILVCFLFLGSFSSALNVLFSIPVSILGAFIVLYFSGFTLNLFTLLALTLAISIVIDDAIMIIENIIRHYRMGKGAAKAAAEGAKEVMPAATAATFAVVAVFLPVAFMSGIIGKYFFQFGIAMSVAVLISLLEAMTITPMRAAAFLKNEPKQTRFENWLDSLFDKFKDFYKKYLLLTLKHRFVFTFISLLLFVGSLFLFKFIRQEFVPPQDQDLIMIQANTKPGSSLDFTDDFAKRLEEIIKQDPDVKEYFVSVGAGGPNAQVNQIFLPVELKPRAERKSNHQQIMARWRELFKEKLDGLRVNMRDISARNLTSGRMNPLAISLRGPDLSVLNDKSNELMKRLEDEKLGVDLDTDYRKGTPELEIIPNRKALYQRGVSVESIGRVLSAAIGGMRQGRYTAEGRRIDIRYKLKEEQIRSAEDIRRLYVRNEVGNLISLKDIVDVKEKPASLSINRVNRQRTVSIYGNIGPGKSQTNVLSRAKEIAAEILPPDYSFALEGASASFNETFRGLMFALAIGILVAYMILAIQFNSFIHPVTILLALPFSISGAFLILWMFNVSLNIFSFIGIIVLMGIAKKNSIMLVEFANHVKETTHVSSFDAVMEASPVRLRPILMTSVATVAAAAPLVFGGGVGSETRIPMGLVIIGGTIVSTVFTLFVVPCVYVMFSSRVEK